MLVRRLQQGITIIEILVSLAIIGILLTLAGPSAGVWLQNVQLRNAADSVVSGLQQAKLEALKRNKLVMFRLTDANSTEWDICLYDFTTDACSVAAGAVLFSKSKNEASFNARVGTEINAAPNPLAPLAPGYGAWPATFTFDPFGRAAATAANNINRIDVRNIELAAKDPGQERRLVILINAAGQIRMCDPKLNKATNPQGCV